MSWIAVPYASKLDEEEMEEKGEVIFVGFICPVSLPRSYEAAAERVGQRLLLMQKQMLSTLQ